ncbi:hypothetical protein ATZ33_06500 [Enterococcus silesiacus]|uniref:Cation efflux protein cytoplasmic domain-containing protein n=1 Tax=Enterococcus silesiacus TaxID=332949 RepID=A0A0S3K9L9_9ENTE|nr:cation transporter dimerization domain-containing protein [Enterococcus silesiacus]ALS01030.1 hypothetical protein ATZ33_06500 [Enterococcus silesiacus]OJG91746.1 hypothetical protein RV15_GL000413 [Enterococcus silesiacus]
MLPNFTFTRKRFGDAVTVDVTIEVDPLMTIEQGERIAEMIERELICRFDIFDVDVQVKPKTPLLS